MCIRDRPDDDLAQQVNNNNNNNNTAGTVADMVATRKTEKYSTLSSAYRFEPVAVEDFGVFGSTTLNFISELGRWICVHTGDARNLFQRISITLQRFNTVLLHDTLPVDLADLWPSDILILAFLVFNPRNLYYLGYHLLIVIITTTMFMVLS